MALSIRSLEVEQLARKLAERSGATMTEEILEALRDREARFAGFDPQRYAQAKAILARIHKRPLLDKRTAEQIIGYDEFGVPQ